MSLPTDKQAREAAEISADECFSVKREPGFRGQQGYSAVNYNDLERNRNHRPWYITGYLAGFQAATALREESEKRARELEQRITYILDDPECELYRNQAAEAIGYRASFPGKATRKETK